jgi:hypothetical protein
MKTFYKILVLFSSVFLMACASSAQITINSSDMPGSGNIIRISNGVAFPGMNAAATGANYSWDYSLLTAASQTVDTFATILSTGVYAFQFYASSYALKSNTAPLSLGGLLTIEYEYDFYKKTTAAYIQTGFGAKFNGFPLPVPFDPTDTIYRFPMNYNNTDSSFSSFHITIPTLGYYGGDKSRVDTVDGWGTLTTPYGTFPVLRVKSVIFETDTIHSDAFGFGFTFPRPSVTEYKWLGTSQKIPLLQIDVSGGFVNQILYRDSLRANPLAVNTVEQPSSEFNIFPNPVSSGCAVEFNLAKAGDVSFDIFNRAGAKVYSESFGHKQPGNQFLFLNLDQKDISAGTYYIRMNVDGKNFQTKTVVKE